MEEQSCQVVPFPFPIDQDTCFGRGECIETCQCKAGWTGRNDFVDLEGRACQHPEVLLRILWGICFLRWLKLLHVHIQVFQAQRALLSRQSSKKSFRGKPKSLWKSPQFLVVCSSLFITVPAILSFLALKVIYRPAIGKDPAVTALYLTGIIVGWGPGIHSQLKTFHTFFDTNLRKTEWVSRISRLFKRLSVLVIVTYVIASAITILFLVALHRKDASVSNDRQRVYTNLIRLVFQVMFMLGQFVITKLLRSAVESRLETVVSSSKGVSNDLIHKALVRIRDVQGNAIRGVLVLGTFSFVFAIPFLAPYAEYHTILLFFLLPGKNHYIRSYLVSRSSTNTATSTHQSQVAPASSAGKGSTTGST